MLRKIYVVLALALCMLLCACGTEPEAEATGIVGTWRTQVSVIDASESTAPFEDSWVTFQFEEDLTGKEILDAGGTPQERAFTYALSDGVITMTFDAEDIREVAYRLEDGKLILTLNHVDGAFERVQ